MLTKIDIKFVLIYVNMVMVFHYGIQKLSDCGKSDQILIFNQMSIFSPLVSSQDKGKRHMEKSV